MDVFDLLQKIVGFEYAFWITVSAIIGTLASAAFAVYKYAISKIESRKIDFIKQIEYYEKELLHTRRIFVASDQTYFDCKNDCEDTLIILERLAYFRNRKLIDQTAIQYFQFWFNWGKSIAEWLNVMESKKMQFHYPNFYSIKDKITYTSDPFVLPKSYMHFLKQKKNNQNYNPWDDKIKFSE